MQYNSADKDEIYLNQMQKKMVRMSVKEENSL